MKRGPVKRTLLAVLAVVALMVGLAGPGAAGVLGKRAETVVTIKTQNGEFWGYLKSPRPAKCADNRKVVLYRQLGKVQSPSTDSKMASDISSKSGKSYMWSTGTTGLRHGKFYAKAVRTPDCKPDTSDTVRAATGAIVPPPL